METFSLIIVTVIGLLLLILNAILWFKLRRFEKMVQNPGDTGANKMLFNKNKEELKKLDKDIQELYEINSRINKITNRGICKIGVVKFNALSEKSGNQSFAVVLLDFRDSGIVISNLQTAHGSRLFVKSIRQGEATDSNELLTEEKKALERARQVVF